MMYKVSEAAEMAGISVRTLHYYDQIGLLSPSEKTHAGYRMYTDADMAMLFQIVMLKELGFSLKRIRELGASSALADKAVLAAQRDVLIAKRARLSGIISTLDSMIKDKKEDSSMSKQFSAFDMYAVKEAQEKYADEVAKKYPKELVDESREKTSRYSKGDWQRVSEAQEGIFRDFAACMEAEAAPDMDDVQKLVKAFQTHLNENFYTCSNEVLAGLGEMYVQDQRFTAYYDNIAPGLAVYIRDAIRYYCNNK